MKVKKWNGSAWVQDYPEVNVSSIVATGTPSGSTFLRGDGAWATITATDSTKLPLAGGTMNLSSGSTSVGIFFNTAQTFTGPQIRGKVQELFRDYYTASYKIWDEGNDGSGSGLDADLLDGQQASFYQNASNLTSGTIPAARVPTLNQNTTGSAATLSTARTLTIGSTGKTFNGSANVSWTLAEIGAQVAGSYAATSHTHTPTQVGLSNVSNTAQLPLTGGTMSGSISLGAAVSHPGNSTPTALSYGRLTGYGDFHINADTDGSTTEFLYLTAGRGAGATDGLRVGFDTLQWRGNTVWHGGNLTNNNQLSNGSGYLTSGSGLNASNLTSGTVPAARIPNAGTTTVGGVKVRLSGSTLFITSNGNNP